ncbi:MAG: alanine racemase [Candidatus Cyclonatronum sp.]|uniref:alanine racemase n=1 Tax=Cyclonatronum sp. TaxID=3024185 RepID=UPI0025C00DC6|nr:alanine racemase [Cyclonatronum sp.]MCC5933371.1 alanine racemase [Balneolales bacterium]MCH8486588.1 alanine racemase [Cyclonatronum sp.]
MLNSTRQITAKDAATSYLEVNGSVLRDNVRLLSEMAGQGIKTMAVVKANAYGHGASGVARALAGKITALGVATVEEAVNLRKDGIITPILVFAPVRRDTLADYRSFNLVATVGSFEELRMISPSMSFHLEFDTGMGRLGFYPEDWPEIRQEVESRQLNPSGIMTHFACADSPSHAKTLQQIDDLNELIRNMDEHARGKLIHASNSGGLLFYKQARYNMVRFGISMYGFSPSETYALPGLKPVMQWKTRVCATKAIHTGGTVSYEASWAAPEDGWLIVLPVGYADGLPRALSNRIVMRAGNKTLPQTGNITMDYTMLFCRDYIETGTEVTIMGDGAMQADEWAAMTGTIPYEILCGIHAKIERRLV